MSSARPWPRSAARADRLTEHERLHALGILERLRHAAPSRAAAAVDDELKAIRAGRRAGGRRHRSA